MDKKYIVVGRRYLYRRKVIYGGREKQADHWVKCINISADGAEFEFDNKTKNLSNEEIKKEIIDIA